MTASLRKLELQLSHSLEGEVHFDEMTRMLYSTDASIYQIPPLGVVFPKHKIDVQRAVQLAADHNIPLLPRGSGTSLSGQAIGRALIMDCSRHLTKVISIEPQKKRVRVQPGVVLDELNQTLAPYDLQFGPDVATSSRANLGGMIGNNSAGARSVVYGKTIDHVHELEVVLSDGSMTTFGPLTADQWNDKAQGSGVEAAAYRTLQQVVRRNGDEIRLRYPDILRRVSGYNLDEFVDAFSESAETSSPRSCLSPAFGRKLYDHTQSPLNMSRMIVGSEGTLGVVVSATLDLVPLPKHRGLMVIHFDQLLGALATVGTILSCQPSAIELIDRLILDLASNNLEVARQMNFVHGEPDALLVVEFSGDSLEELHGQTENLRNRLTGNPQVGEIVPAIEPSERDAVWRMRKHGMGLLYGIPGARKPISFVEDTAIPTDHLSEFVNEFKNLLQRYDADGSFYGHASVGCIHIRPLMDLKKEQTVKDMHAIAEQVTDLVLKFDGALSGEHGDGLARSMWNEKLYGPAIYEGFQKVKEAFDPHGLLNPGKVVNAADMRNDLRADHDRIQSEPRTTFEFSREGGMASAVEMCNGSGACRKTGSGTMCPSFMATSNEMDSTRARANALRNAMSGFLPQGSSEDHVFEILDLCLMCKGCRAECPSNVDMAKLKAEFLQHYYEDRGVPLANWMMGHIRQLSQLGSLTPGIANWIASNGFVRSVLEQVAGIDRRRTLPRLTQSFHRWFKKNRLVGSDHIRGKVILFDDCFTTFNEPGVAKAAVRVLEAAGYHIELANVGCCGRTMFSKGMVNHAAKLARQHITELAARVGEDVPLLGLEPSCILSFKDEYQDLGLGDRASHVAEHSFLIEDWLAGKLAQGGIELPLKRASRDLVFHGHCHQKALVGTTSTVELFQHIPGQLVAPLTTGCCGMAGSFGYEKKHYDVSRQIAERDLIPKLASYPESLASASGFSCRHQIRDFAQRTAMHPIEIIAEHLQQ